MDRTQKIKAAIQYFNVLACFIGGFTINMATYFSWLIIPLLMKMLSPTIGAGITRIYTNFRGFVSEAGILKNTLTKREYTVICLRFGLKGDRNYAQREVAKFLKISRSYISRIEKKAIEKLQTAFRKQNFYC
jgi:predicted XRE-type DNA-binding protein